MPRSPEYHPSRLTRLLTALLVIDVGLEVFSLIAGSGEGIFCFAVGGMILALGVGIAKAKTDSTNS